MISLTRFLLAISVVIFHLHKPVIVPSPSAYVSVLLFYFISGFIMQKAVQNYVGKNYRLRFIGNRVLRLFPLLLIFNFLGLLGKEPIYNSIIYTSNVGNFSKLTEAGQPKIFLTGLVTGCVPGWSIMIELLFYLFLVFKSKKFWEDILLVVNLIVIGQGIYIGGFNGFEYVYSNFFGTCMFFILGMKLSRYMDSGQSISLRFNFTAIHFTFLIILIAMPYVYRFDLDELLAIGILISIGLTLLSLAIVAGGNSKSAPSSKNRFFEYLGSLSFPLYICHTYWIDSSFYYEIEPKISSTMSVVGGKIWAELFAIIVALMISHVLLVIVVRPIDRVRIRIKQVKK